MAALRNVVLLISILNEAKIAKLMIQPFEDTNEGLIEAASKIIIDNISSRYSVVNFVKASKSQHEANDFIGKLVSRNRMNFICRIDEASKMKFSKGKKKNNFILLDDIASFRIFNEKVRTEMYFFSGFYVLALVRGNINEIDEMFSTFWKKGIFNVIVMYDAEKIVKVLTFFPFTGSMCNNTKPTEINEYRNGRFVNPIGTMFPDKFKNLKQCQLTISTYEDDLSVMRIRKPDGTLKLSGFDIELLNELSKLLNFRPVFKFIDGKMPYGLIFDNGTVTGALGDVVSGRSQIAVGRIYVVPKRMMIADGVTYYSFPEVFVISPGRKLSNAEKLLQPFQLLVWIALILLLTLSFSTIFVMKFMSQQLKAFVYGSKVSSPGMNVLIAVFGMSQRPLPKQNFSRFILMMFLIFCLVIRSAYQGSLYKFLQEDKDYVSVETIKDLIDQEFDLYMYPDIGQELFGNQPNVMARYSEQTLKDKPLLKVLNFRVKNFFISKISGNRSLIDTPLSSTSRIAFQNAMTNIIAANIRHKNEFAHTVCKQYIWTLNVAMFFPKNFYLVKTISTMMSRLHAAGIVHKIINEFVDMKYWNFKTETVPAKALSMKHLEGSFYLLLYLSVTSLTVFICELLHSACIHLKRILVTKI